VLLSAQPLSYTVSWLGIPVVDVTITRVNSDTALVAEYRARTRPWFDRLYSVDNRYRIRVDPDSGYPGHYEKQVLEQGRADSLWACYEHNPRRVVYANGLERPWREGTHAFFSALLWVQQHAWQADEELVLLVEVEGVLWQVTVQCTEMVAAVEPEGPLVAVTARFDRQVSGEPVLSTTDILTYMLPGVGHRLRFGLNPERQEIEWAEFGSRPFMVRAELNSIPEHP